MDGGVLDVAISHAVDSRGINHWSIHLYKELDDAALETDSNVSNRTVYQCVGNLYDFRVTANNNYNQTQEPAIDESIRVTEGMVDVDMRDADEALRGVPVDNTSWEYSGQIWVFDALDELYDMELFPDDHYAAVHARLCHLHQGAEDMPAEIDIYD
jgi:hypothetical protein